MERNKIPAPHPQVAARIVDEQAVIVLADSGEVNVLNVVATRVWELIDGVRTTREIVSQIASEFDVTRAQAEEDVDSFLRELAAAQMIQFVDDARI